MLRTATVEDIAMASHPDGQLWRNFGFGTMRDVNRWTTMGQPVDSIEAWTHPPVDLLVTLNSPEPMTITEAIEWQEVFYPDTVTPNEAFLWRCVTQNNPGRARILRDAGIDPTALFALQQTLLVAYRQLFGARPAEPWNSSKTTSR